MTYRIRKIVLVSGTTAFYVEKSAISNIGEPYWFTLSHFTTERQAREFISKIKGEAIKSEEIVYVE